jgi:predicted nuclease with TOPRIM domain
VDELKNDIRMQERDHEDLAEAYKRLQKEHALLKTRFRETDDKKIRLETKHMKHAIHTELLENRESITQNTFFEEKSGGGALLQNTLVNSVSFCI